MSWMNWNDRRDVSAMLGKVLTAVEGGEKGSDEIKFFCQDGTEFRMQHDQDCCESVSIEDVVGNWSDLIGFPLLVCEEVSNADGPQREQYDESFTWTFYKFATVKGYVDLRWYGTSNGYYSEGVDFYEVPNEPR